nr:hypothetical protein [Tanacetum cinerariifolium]
STGPSTGPSTRPSTGASTRPSIGPSRGLLRAFYRAFNEKFRGLRGEGRGSSRRRPGVFSKLNEGRNRRFHPLGEYVITLYTSGMFKLDIEPISARLMNNKDAHEVYIDKTIEYANTLCGFIERARTEYPSEPLLESACMFTTHVLEFLVYACQTCSIAPKPSEKLLAVTPVNKDKRIRFTEPITSSNNIPKQTDSLKTKDSNKPLLTSTGVIPTTSASGSKPSGNTKNNKISGPPHSN